MRRHLPVQLADSVLLLCMLVPFGANLRAQSNEVLGEIELVGATKVEKTSGVWVDGQYLGYLKELKGSKKILLLPGPHEIVARTVTKTSRARSRFGREKSKPFP